MGIGIALILGSGLVAIGAGAANVAANPSSYESSKGMSYSSTASASSRSLSVPTLGSNQTTLNVEVINETGVAATADQQLAPDGKTLQVYLRRAIQETIASGHADQVIGARFGTRPVGARVK